MNINQDILRKIKNRVFNESRVPSSEEIDTWGISPLVVGSWVKTHEMGVDCKMDRLSDASKDSLVLSRMYSVIKNNWRDIYEYLENLGAILDILGAAIYFLDDKLAVIDSFGNKKVIQRMKKHGIKFGRRLSAQYLGIHPVNIAQAEDSVVKFYGQEHALDMFSDMVSFAAKLDQPAAMPFREFDSSLMQGNYVVWILLPVSECDERAENICALCIEKFLPMSSLFSGFKSCADLFVMGKESNNIPTAFLSPDGKIMYVNRFFEEEFETIFEICVGGKIGNIFPDMAFVEEVIRKQTVLKLERHSTVVNGVEKAYYIQTQYLREKNYDIKAVKVSFNTRGNVDFYLKKFHTVGNTAIFTFDSLLGKSTAFSTTKEIAERAAQGDSNIIIEGESGTGKELFSQAIHNASSRAGGPFVAVNCGSIPKELIGSELFGYETGAFTGAKKGGQIGKIELANGGTLFLDEITEMPLDMQSYLLRALEERQVCKIGGLTPQKVDVRIIAATNRNLMSYVREGKFRLDLYYRLNVIKLDLPPLRERDGDIEELINQYLGRFSMEFNKPRLKVDEEAMKILTEYSWPGNVREVRNVVEYCANMAKGAVITVDDLPIDIRSAKKVEFSPYADNMKWDYKAQEYQKIKELMIKERGNKSKVAKAMGMSRNTLSKRLAEMGE